MNGQLSTMMKQSVLILMMQTRTMIAGSPTKKWGGTILHKQTSIWRNACRSSLRHRQCALRSTARIGGCGDPYASAILPGNEGGVMAGISVFFPAYNDGGTIASMVIAAAQTLQSLTDDYEIIVVKNGSTDDTVEVLDALTSRFEHLRVLTSPPAARLRRRAPRRLRQRDEGARLLHGQRRAVRRARVAAARRRADAGGGHRQRLQDQPLRPAHPHHHRPPLPLRDETDVPLPDPGCGLRFPPDPPPRLREGPLTSYSGIDLRRVRHEGRRSRLHLRRSPGPPLTTASTAARSSSTSRGSARPACNCSASGGSCG